MVMVHKTETSAQPRSRPLALEPASTSAAALEHRLVLQRCASCGIHRHPPRPLCPYCHSFAAAWTEVPGTGTLFTYAVVHQALLPALGDVVPYVVAIVELVEQASLRLVTNVVGMPPDQVRIGLPVSVRFLQQEDVWLPLFERAA